MKRANKLLNENQDRAHCLCNDAYEKVSELVQQHVPCTCTPPPEKLQPHAPSCALRTTDRAIYAMFTEVYRAGQCRERVKVAEKLRWMLTSDDESLLDEWGKGVLRALERVRGMRFPR